jgi:2,5-diamino-6-(ribosylamino)-4(3H)-pyrimidinone 5'-phosphate reductase
MEFRSEQIVEDSIYSFNELALPVSGVRFGDHIRPYTIFNMVSSLDGKTTTNGAGLEGLGSPIDRKLMHKLRSQVDAVLVGGNTLRTDPFVPTVAPTLMQERIKNFSDRLQPLGIVVSRKGDLPLEHRFWQAERDLRLVFVSNEIELEQQKLLEQRSQVRQISSNPESGNLNLAEIMRILFSEYGIKRLLIEAGATLNYALINQNFADELFLTISPHLVGGKQNSTVLEGDSFLQLRNLELKSCYPIENHLFLRYRFQS